MKLNSKKFEIISINKWFSFNFIEWLIKISGSKIEIDDFKIEIVGKRFDFDSIRTDGFGTMITHWFYWWTISVGLNRFSVKIRRSELYIKKKTNENNFKLYPLIDTYTLSNWTIICQLADKARPTQKVKMNKQIR